MQKIEYHHTAGDSRLLYGMGGPLLVAVALIVAVLMTGEMWLIPFLMIAVIALTTVVLWGLGHMLEEDEQDSEQQ